MSSFIFNNTNTVHKHPAKETMQESFWQSSLWVDILSKTNQAEIIVASNNTAQIVIERRKIWNKYTGLYILGANPGSITKEFLEEIKKTLLTPTDLFLQIEPVSYAQMKNEE